MTVTSTAQQLDHSSNARPKRLFVGWIMIGFSAAAQFMSGPGQSYSVSAFKKPMQDTLAISETNLSFAYFVATIISGLLLPWTGRMIDRFGARVVLPTAASLLAASCVVMSSVSSVAGLYVGFTLIRCVGQGAMWLVGTWIVGEWFLRKRGIATAVSGLGSSLSVMFFPLLNVYLINRYGWQTAWKWHAVIVAISIVVPAILFLRNRPEDIGQHPDGIPPDLDIRPNDSKGRVPNKFTEEAWTLSEVLANATFWKLLSVGICAGMIGTGIVFHQETILGAYGISKTLAMQLISIQAAVGTLAAFWAGRLTDRVPSERLLAVSMLMQSAAVALICFLPHWTFVFLFAALGGLHGSIIRTAGTIVWVNYYGRLNQGVIRGAAMSAMILAAAVGPLPLAISQDKLGTYRPALIAFAILPLISMMLVRTARKPTRVNATQPVDLAKDP
ncbi:MAG: MFS transporter [Planctomycetales bacterium]|nr:MFS transporter [Planctomycetales bacterium]